MKLRGSWTSAMISSVSEIHLGLWKVNAHFVLQKASEVENIGVPDFGTNVIGQKSKHWRMQVGWSQQADYLDPCVCCDPFATRMNNS